MKYLFLTSASLSLLLAACHPASESSARTSESQASPSSAPASATPSGATKGQLDCGTASAHAVGTTCNADTEKAFRCLEDAWKTCSPARARWNGTVVNDGTPMTTDYEVVPGSTCQVRMTNITPSARTSTTCRKGVSLQKDGDGCSELVGDDCW